MSDKPSLTIDGKSYEIDSLSDATKNQIMNLRVVEAKIAQLQQDLGIAQTARNAYASALKESLPQD